MTNKQYIQDISTLIQLLSTDIDNEVSIIIACQSALETNFGKSTICVEQHNYFGMKLPKVRMTTAKGERREHAIYYSKRASILDYILYINYNKFNKKEVQNVELFLNKLTSLGYATDPNYKTKIEQIYKQFKTQK